MYVGKCMREYKGYCEVSVMEKPEDDVRTRARAMDFPAVNSRTAKRRKVDDEEANISSSVSHLNRFVVTPDNSVSHVNAGNSACSSASSDDIPASCCSSSRSTDEEERVELEPSTYSFDCRQSRETKTATSDLQSESGELESTARPSEANSNRQPMESSVSKFEAEIEKFFLAEEKHLVKQFSEKYNFDFVNEKPMEGRFEWVKLKQ